MRHIDKIDPVDIPGNSPMYDSLLLDCLWPHKYQSITESKQFLCDHGNTFFSRLRYTDMGILQTEEKTGLFYVSKVQHLSENEMQKFIKSVARSYPDMTIRSLATVLVQKYPCVFDQLSITERVAILAYLMNEPKKSIQKRFPYINIQQCIDNLWMRISQVYMNVEEEI